MLKRNWILALLAISIAGTAQAKNPTPDHLYQWCDSVTRDLEIYRGVAYQKEATGRNESAVNTLLEGLDRALATRDYSGRRGLITYMAIARTKRVAEEMRADLAAHPYDNGTGVAIPDRVTTLYFLKVSYDYIQRVAREFDVPYMIPFYYSNCYPSYRCNGQFGPELQASLFEFTREQLALPLEQLILPVETRSYYGRTVTQAFPLGSSRGFMLAVKRMAELTAMDIATGIYRNAYACQVASLRWLSQSIGGFAPTPRAQIAQSQIVQSLPPLAEEVQGLEEDVVDLDPYGPLPSAVSSYPELIARPMPAIFNPNNPMDVGQVYGAGKYILGQLSQGCH